MSISSLSLTFFSMTGAAPAPERVAPAANDGAAVPAQACEPNGQSHGRRNVLYEAMMAALREMGLTAGPPQPAPVPGTPSPIPAPVPVPLPAPVPTPVATAPTAPTSSPVAPGAPGAGVPVEPATPPAASVEDVVFAFASALLQAVRGGREHGESRHENHDGRDHEGHHGHRRHGHHGEGFGMSRGYSGLATRLEALAVRFDSSTGAVNASPAAAPASTTVEPAVEPAPVPSTTPAPAATPATPVSSSPLSQAFDAMMSVLRSINPNAPSAGSASPTLASFLHSLARGLNADRAAPTMSGVGIVINITA